MSARVSLAARFWSKVDKNGPIMPGMKTRCWVWVGALRNGYGAIGVGRRVLYAHRLSLEWATGAALKNCAVHKCDNRCCIRPTHLSDSTKKFNSQDMVLKGRSARGDRHGMRLHPDRVPRAERSGTACLTWEAVAKIRSAYPASSLSKLAAEHGVAVATIHKVVRGETWKT